MIFNGIQQLLSETHHVSGSVLVLWGLGKKAWHCCPRGHSSRRASGESCLVWGQIRWHQRNRKDVRSVPPEHCEYDLCSQFPELLSSQQSPTPLPASALNKNLIKKNQSGPVVPKGDLWTCARLTRLPQMRWGKREQCGGCFLKLSLCATKGSLCIVRLSSYILVRCS